MRGARGSKREQGGGAAREARPLSLTEDPSLQKAFKGSQGFLRPQEGPRDPERPRKAQGVRGVRRSKREQWDEGEQGKQSP